MLARKLITTNLRSKKCLGLASFNTSTPVASIYDEEKIEKPERKLREWRKVQPVEDSALKMFERKQPKGKEFRALRMPVPQSPREMKQWFNHKVVEYEKFTQRFLPERHETLGCDLAAAHFLVFRDGKVKFIGNDKWFQKDADETLDDLPAKYDPYWQLTHIDATGIKLYYDGLANFINLGRVTWASFSGNPHFDDWCLDKIIAQLPKLEYLDLSECKKFTEIGLGAVYRLYNLKELIVTDFNKVPSFELTCIMLEDLNSNLKITIKEPKEEKKK